MVRTPLFRRNEDAGTPNKVGPHHAIRFVSPKLIELCQKFRALGKDVDESVSIITCVTHDAYGRSKGVLGRNPAGNA